MKSSYETKMERYTNLKGKVKLPTYQRRLVWNERQKIEFLESIHQNYPTGSLLLYQYQNEEKYSLIDGLQRYSTLNDYEINKSKYIAFDEHFVNIESKLIEKVSSQYATSFLKKLKEICIKVFSDDESRYDSIYKAVKEDADYLGALEYLDDIDFFDLYENIKKMIENYINIDKLDIPCIYFTGDQSQLAEIFERLNRSGVKLSKYQIFASQWEKNKISLKTSGDSDDKNAKFIIDALIKRYEELNCTRNIEIEGYDKYEFEEKMEITLSEFCYTIGVKILETCDVIFSGKHKDALKNEDIANELGYSTFGIVLGIKNNELARIPEKFESYNDVNLLLSTFEKIESIYKEIQEKLVEYYTLPSSNVDAKIMYKHYGFQFLSFFASLWVKKYGTSENLQFTELPKYSSEYNKILNNIPYYYIYDMLRSRWTASGDSKLNEIYMDNNIPYLEKINIDSFEQNLIEWNEANLSKKSIQIKSDVKIFLTFFYKIMGTTFENSDYDFEHIVPKKRIDELPDKFKIPGGSLGNVCLMYFKDNRSKKDKTVYQDNENSENKCLKHVRLAELFYPSESELDFLSTKKTHEETYEEINKLLTRRSKDLITSLVNKLRDKMRD